MNSGFDKTHMNESSISENPLTMYIQKSKNLSGENIPTNVTITNPDGISSKEICDSDISEWDVIEWTIPTKTNFCFYHFVERGLSHFY